jgi:hypothetical protein
MKAVSDGLINFLLWTPRILGILFTFLVSIFAFDVFGQGAGFLKTLLALLVHLIPTFLLIVILVVSWKRPWIGGLSFVLLGVAYLIWKGFAYPVIYIAVFLVGILFLLSWIFRKQISETPA